MLLTGESGTGKELFAQLVHESSARAEQKLVCVNCAALPGTLIESELFGHEKGSFTDAVAQRKGRFETADQGSLFLDEISEVPFATQAKLLRVLENSEFERVGSSETIRHNVRVIAASNRALKQQVKEGHFRLDLYHRLNIIELRIPALRERREDLPLLAMHFLKQFHAECAQPISGFTKCALQAMNRYDWPGNVRELRNVIHRACILADDAWITAKDLELGDDEVSDSKTTPEVPENWLDMELADIERHVILASIAKHGNQRVVAETLGVSARTLTNKMRRYRQTGHLEHHDTDDLLGFSDSSSTVRSKEESETKFSNDSANQSSLGDSTVGNDAHENSAVSGSPAGDSSVGEHRRAA